MAKKNPFDELMSKKSGTPFDERPHPNAQKGGEKGFMKAFKNAKKKSGQKKGK